MSNAVQQRLALPHRPLSVALLSALLVGVLLALTVPLATPARAAMFDARAAAAHTTNPVACVDSRASGRCVGADGRLWHTADAAAAQAGTAGAARSAFLDQSGEIHAAAPGTAPTLATMAVGPHAWHMDNLTRASIALGLAAVAIVLLEVMRRRVAVTAPADAARAHHRTTRGGPRRASRL